MSSSYEELEIYIKENYGEEYLDTLLNVKAKQFTSNTLNKYNEQLDNYIKELHNIINTTPQQAWNNDLIELKPLIEKHINNIENEVETETNLLLKTVFNYKR